MENLTFGEQVKIILGRKGMTIKELSEIIEERTGKKMSRQNLTQRLSRDNFQEQDMRMIANILGCPFQLSILNKEEAASYGDGQKTQAAMPEQDRILAEAGLGQSGQEQAEELLEEDAEEMDAGEIDMTIGELYEIHEELSELEENAEAGESIKAIKEELSKTGDKGKEKKEKFLTGGIFLRKKSQSAHDKRQASHDRKQPSQESHHSQAGHPSQEGKPSQEGHPSQEGQPSQEGRHSQEKHSSQEGHHSQEKHSSQEEHHSQEKHSSQAGRHSQESHPSQEGQQPSHEGTQLSHENVQEAKSAHAGGVHKKKAAAFDLEDFEPVIRHDDAEENLKLGEVNPYTGREYQSNSVRMHPSRIGYVQVYDRNTHKWTDMTEWAFLGYQERKKALLGKEYEPPIYLD